MRAMMILGSLVMLLFAGGSVPAATAQDASVGFEDLSGLESAITRTFSGNADLLSAPAPVMELRELRQPEVLLMLVAVFEFDTEANAAAGYELLRDDINATGVYGDPLPLTDIDLGVDLEYTARVAEELRTPAPVDFTIVAALDGTLIHSVIGITRGMPPHRHLAQVVQSMIAGEYGTDPVTFRANGTSTGGLWDHVPTQEAIGRYFRNVIDVVDAAPFPA
jgi:hypothetical protein